MPPLPQDDLSIPDSDRLFRAVKPNLLVSEPDGTMRPSSAVFKTQEMSVNIESLMVEQGRSPEETLERFPGWLLTSIIAGDVRRFSCPIVKATAPPNDPAHGLVLGKKTGAFANAMRRSARWIVAPGKV